jgi:hypothetical protein
MGADQRGDDAAAIDIADQHDRHAGARGKAHIGDVPGPEVDFRRRTRTLDNDEIGAGGDRLETFHDGAHQLRLQRLVVARLRLPEHPALHDDLAADIRLRLQENRVHVHGGRHAGSQRLQPLRPADLAAIRRDGGIVRHVLRLERTHRQPAVGGNAAKPRHQYRFSDIRAGALQHDRSGHAALVAFPYIPEKP